jgi:1-acyl-sn-glycerol-3-phosphate acyltransferase
MLTEAGFPQSDMLWVATPPRPTRKHRQGDTGTTLHDTVLWRRTLFHFSRASDRLLCRLVVALGRRQITSIYGLENIACDRDPFIAVSNHNHRLDAIILPTTLIFFRDGKTLHFIADWPILTMPLAGQLLRRSGAIISPHKRAKIAAVNRFHDRLTADTSPLEQARERILSGASVGVFPEGTMNRNPQRLLRGNRGAAHLSLTTGAPIVPIGVRFPDHDPNKPIGDLARMSVHIGSPMTPHNPTARPTREETRHWHETMMAAISRLSGKRPHHQGDLTR